MSYTTPPREPPKPAWPLLDDSDTSMDVPVPDFNYPWLADAVDSDKDKAGLAKAPPPPPPPRPTSTGVNTPGSDGGPASRLLLSSLSHTPPVSSLVNTSAVSAASSYPTPPGTEYPSNSSRGGASSSAADKARSKYGSVADVGELGQILGRGRVVSAPVGMGEDSNQPKTAEYRTDTASTLARRSNFVTPGLTQRTIAPSTQASGRLSRFGGPARRGQFQAPDLDMDPETPKEEDELSPPPSTSTPVRDPPPLNRYSPEPERRYSLEHKHDDVRHSADLDRPVYKHRSPDVPERRYEPRDPTPPRQATPELRDRERPWERDYLQRDRERERERDREREHEVDREPQHRDRARSRYSPPAPSAYPERRTSPPPLSSSGRENRPVVYADRPVPETKRKVVEVTEREYHRPPEVREVRRAESRDLRREEPPRHIPNSTSPVASTAPPAAAPVPIPAPVPPQPQPQPQTQTAPPAPLPAAVAPASKRNIIVNGKPYERLAILGKGGSSKVYSVLCPTTRIVYAIKRVVLERADKETFQSYTNEIELLRRLKGHDRIIQLVDHQISFTPSNKPKILNMVMECGEIDFSSLLEEQRGQPLNLNFVGLYWQQMLEAVQAVHAENVVHTDLKPANFVLVKGRLKIIDFGIAKAIANDTVNIHRDQQVGTVNYMSPEAIQKMNGQKIFKLSYPADVWSLGCILYQMIYGHTPFQHITGNIMAKLHTIADPNTRIEYPATSVSGPSATVGNPTPPRYTVPVPTAAISSIRGCLEHDKEKRLTIPELLKHEFLVPRLNASSSSPTLPPGATSITKDQMAMLVNYLLRANGVKPPPPGDRTAEELFDQLESQNLRSQGQ